MKQLYRQKRIIEVLLEQDSYITIAKLAATLDVSSRTIRNELNRLKPILQDMGLELMTKPGSGVYLEADLSTKLTTRHLIGHMDFSVNEKYGFSPEQRQNYILLNVLTSDEPIKVSEIEKDLYISRATAFNDFTAVEERLTRYKIGLLRHKNSGITATGKERHIRTCLLDLLLTDDDMEAFTQVMNGESITERLLFPGLQINSQFLALFCKQMQSMDYFRKTQLSLGEKSRLVLRCLISAKRYAKGHEVHVSSELLTELQSLHPLEDVLQILAPIEAQNRISLSEQEKRYLQVFFLAADGSYVATTEGKTYATDLVQSFISDWSTQTSFALTEDSVLATDLYENLLRMETRFIFGIHSEFSLTEEIKNANPSYFPMVQESLKPLEEKYGFLGSDEEIARLVLNLVSALKRQTSLLKILLFCQLEMSLIQVMKEDLLLNFGSLEIECERNLYQLQKRKLDDFDLILSNSTLHMKTSTPMLTIPALLTAKDVSRLHETFYKLRQAKLKSPKLAPLKLPHDKSQKLV